MPPTALAPSPLLHEHHRLLTQLREVMSQNPRAVPFRLLFVPDGMSLAPDEVLVQVVNSRRGVLELHPRRMDDLEPGDLIHASQLLDPASTALDIYTQRGARGGCLAVPDNGRTKHWYT